MKRISLALVAALVLALGLPSLQVDAREGFVEVDWQPDGTGVWEPGHEVEEDYDNPEILREQDNSAFFIPSGRRFTQEDLPVGSIIEITGDDTDVFANPRHWAQGGIDNHQGDDDWIHASPAEEEDTAFVLTEDWWAGKEYFAINAGKIGVNFEEDQDAANEVISKITFWAPEGSVDDTPVDNTEDDTPTEDETTTEDETEATEDNNQEENPQTSDMTNNSLYLLLAAVSLLGLGALGFAKRKSNNA